MWRALLLAGLLAMLTASAVRAQTGPWETCRGGPGRTLTDCRPVAGRIDPQGRELWLRAPVAPRRDEGAKAFVIYGVGASEVWFNGVRLGANGQPGATAEAERPGRYMAEFPIPDPLWRAEGNVVVVRMSAFHGGLRFDHPIGVLGIGPYPQPSRLSTLAITFVAAGSLLAAAFGFAAIYATRRTGSALTLAALAAVGAAQALLENLRSVWRYEYPVHAWRIGAIWILAVAFSILLVAWAGARFAPRRRRALLWIAAVAVPASYLAPGFDNKTSLALLTGVALAAVATLAGVRSRTAGAWPTLAWLAAFTTAGLALPFLLLDLSFFVLAAGLTLPLLLAELLRLGREDRDREAALTRAASRPDRLTVATARGVVLTPLGDIVAIVGADDYAELRLSGGRSLLHAARLERLAAQLPPSFVRIHRSVIANLEHVERLERDGARWRLHMDEGPPLPVSRSRLPAVREALDPPPPLLRATA